MDKSFNVVCDGIYFTEFEIRNELESSPSRNVHNLKICNKCKKQYCRYKCADKIISINNKLICTSCYGDKLK